MRRWLAIGMACAAVAATAHGADVQDWPMWGYDAARSFNAPAVAPEAMHVQWTRELVPPRRAWRRQLDDGDKLEFDLSYAPVVHNGMLFVSSMTADRLTAYDAATGEERWRYYADGPMRLAPAAWNGHVYVGSDDGQFHCLNAADGTVRWTFDAKPTGHRVLGNERVISFWPVRGGPVIKDGIVYVASGVWPFLGTFVFALDAETGTKVWANTGHASAWQRQPHNGAYSFAGVAPQGYLAASADHLVVSGGRSLPAVFDRHTGRFLELRIRRGDDRGHAVGGYRVRIEGDYYYDHGRVRPLPNLASGDDVDDEAEKPEHDTPRSRWLARARPLAEHLDGEPFEVLAAAGSLFVVTDKGVIHCFGSEPRQSIVHAYAPVRPESRDDEAGRRAEAILNDTGHRQGYALFLGAGDGDLIEQIAVRSTLHIVGIERDAAKIAALRQRFDDAGLYGERIALLPGDPAKAPYPKYISSLIVMEDAVALGRAPDVEFLETVYERLRPYNGRAVLMACDRTQAALADALVGFKPENGRATLADGVVTLARTGPLPGAGEWTHQYANAGQTVQSGDERVRVPLGPVWYGGPNNHNVLPRHGLGPRPHVAGGRVTLMGPDTLSARCAFTGREQWERSFPGIGSPFTTSQESAWQLGRAVYLPHRPGATFIGSPFVTMADSLYVRYQGRIVRLDAALGKTLAEWALYEEDQPGNDVRDHGGHISVSGATLIVTLTPDVFDRRDDQWRASDYDYTSSRRLAALDRHTGEILWTREARNGFRHNAIVAGNGRVFVNDLLSETAMRQAARRGAVLAQSPQLLALDIRTGAVLWSQESEAVFGTFLCYSTEHDVLLEGGTGEGKRGWLSDEPGHRLAARRGHTGERLWRVEAQRGRNPLLGPYIVRGDTVIVGGRALGLLTGAWLKAVHPVLGGTRPWAYAKSYGCGSVNAGMNLLAFRSGAAGFYDLGNDGGTGNLGGFKSGCTPNLIPADGLLNAPDYTRTCTCSYQNQTSLGLIHMPELELWTYDPPLRLPAQHGAMARIGINVGAPGNRKAVKGTLWLPYPHGALDTQVQVQIDSDTFFRKHALWVDGTHGLNWVAASGVRDLQHFELGVSGGEQPYAVTLHFCEPDTLSPGQRVFDIRLQGKTVRQAFDIAAAAGGPDRAWTLTFEDIVVGRTLRVDLTPAAGTDHLPVLSGVELNRGR